MSDQVVEPINNTDAAAFIGLQSYTEAQAGIFYGRDEEINKLTKLVQSNILTIVFGKSGTGKTSLLNAGVFPKLRKDYCLPFRIRLEFQEDSPDLITQIKEVLKAEIDKYGFKTEQSPSAEPLWQYFHTEPLWSSITPILVFDQFEEMFTLAKKSSRFKQEDLAVFWEELSDLIENSIPEKLKAEFLNHKENIDYNYKVSKVKIVFAFREEFLPEFETITTKIPSIKYSRFRLMQMNGNQAYDVITKTWKDKIDPAEAKEIVSFFTSEEDKDKGYDLLEIEPSLLSQVCFYIDKERMNEGSDKVSAALLDKYPKEIILRSIYNEVLSESNNALPVVQDTELKNPVNPVKVFVEDKLITDEGYRTKYALTEQDESLRPGIEVLKGKYFLRDDGKSVELTHDVLAPLIKADREKRRKDIALTIARERARRRALRILAGALLLSLLGAVLIYFFTTKQAREYKADAEKKAQEFRASVLSDSLRWNKIKDSIRNLTGLPKGGKKGASGTPGDGVAAADSLLINGIDSTDSQITLRRIAFLDSTIRVLNVRLQKSSEEKNNIALLNNELNGLIDALARLKRADSIQFIKNYDFLNNNYSQLKNEHDPLKISYVNLKGEYDVLKRNFDEYKLRYPAVKFPPVPPPPPDGNNLQLEFTYSTSKSTGTPRGVTMYLIPDSPENKKIISKAKLFEVGCNDAMLQSAKGQRSVPYTNQKYVVFPDVPPGKYFIKICAYYGGYYLVTKKAVGNETVKLDLSPAVKHFIYVPEN